jgi:hypothetical protein
MTDAAKAWTAEHLPWITIGLLSLWLPPVIGAVAFNGRWTDPAELMTVVELTAMSAALPGLLRHQVIGWKLLCASRVMVLAHTSWIILLNSRLNGVVPTLLTKPVVEAALGLCLSFYVLGQVRGQYPRAAPS